MTKDEALKLALEALEEWLPTVLVLIEKKKSAITAIKEALAQPEQEQFALKHRIAELEGAVIGLQAQRTWVGLTDEEIQTEWVLTPQNDKAEGIWFGRRIEAKLKEKNHV